MQTPKHPFSSDRPIRLRTEDLLGRVDFSEALATAVKSWRGKDSLVIALYGQWGSGKTSVKNIALDALRSTPQDCPRIIEFNPWQWAGQEQVANAFFDEIGKALGGESTGQAKRIAKRWRLYAARLHVTTYVATGFRNTLFFLLVVIAFLGIGGTSVPSWAAGWPAVIGYSALGLAILTKWFGGFAEKLAAALDASSALQEKSLADVKRELGLSLQELDRPLLVVIDDVDRLSIDEIRLLFQLVKVNADFPNLVYLLLFQRDIIRSALDKLSPAPGEEFLEKIVQVGLNIPRLEGTRLERALFDGLDRILTEEGLAQKFDHVRWANVFIPGLRPYFQTLRDVFRYLGTLEFHVGIFKKGGSLEVNPIDLIAVEALRLFEPAVYDRLHDAKASLTSMANGEEKKGVRKDVEEILALAGTAGQSQVKHLLSELFPNIEWVLGGSTYGPDWSEGWYRESRICHRDVFDKYFYLTIPTGDISQSSIERLLDKVGDRPALVAAFRELNQQELLGVALDRLEAYKEKIGLDVALPFITALFDISDEVPEAAPGFTSLSPELHLSRIVYWYLRQEKDREKRAEILMNAAKQTTGLYGPIARTSNETRDPRKARDEDAFLVSEDAAKQLQAICLEKIRSAARAGALPQHRELASILYRWRDWAAPEEPRAWVHNLVESDDGVLALLTAFLQQSTSQGLGDYAARIRWRIRLSALEPFIEIDELDQRVNRLQRESLSDRETEAVKQLRRAVDRRRTGKSEDDFWDRDDD